VVEAYLGYAQLSPLYTLPRETKESRECEEVIDLWLGNSPNSPVKAPAYRQYNIEYLNNTPQFQPGPEYDEVKAATVFGKLLQDAEAEVRCVAV